jgi:serine phosphatase RsbU (regulator of sigma subunit)
MTLAGTELPSTIEVKGAFIMSAIQTLAEFRKLGESALAEQGVTELQAHTFYPVQLRRSVHSAIYDRFGTPGIFWVGLETPHHFTTREHQVESAMQQAIEPVLQVLSRASTSQLPQAVSDYMQALLAALNVTVHDSVRGHSFEVGWSLQPVGPAQDMGFRLCSVTTSYRDHEAFARGILHHCLRTYTPDALDFELRFDRPRSEEHPGYSRAFYDLRFTPMPPGQTQALMLAQERSEAREALFKRALEHAMAQEQRASQALDALAKSHQYTLESIHYAAALQRHQLPGPARWRERVRDLAAHWEPKDVIGGDMWWMDESSDGHIRLALIDCTGHGVPGAMLALLVSNTLERLYLNTPDLRPAKAIEGIQQALQQSFGRQAQASGIDNGCDLVLLDIDPQRQCIHAALAGLGLMLWRQQEQKIEWVTSPRSGISSQPQSLERVLTRDIAYTRGDRLLLVTDGVTDQIGEAKPPRAWGYRRLQASLSRTGALPLQQCLSDVLQALNDWQGQQPRRDDVTLVALDLP